MIGSADIPIAMPAQGLGRCDLPPRRLVRGPSRIAMPAQGLGRCDKALAERSMRPSADRNARAGAWTLRPVALVAWKFAPAYRNARAGAWTLRHRYVLQALHKLPADRNARAGAWTLRQP